MFNKIVDWINKSGKLHLLFYGALLAFCWPILHHKAYANDLWKALYSGRYFALNLSFPSHAEFTFSPVVEIVLRDAYNWLSNLVFYGFYQIGGIPVLQIFFRFGLVIFAIIITHSIISYKINPLIFMMLIFMVIGFFQKLRLRAAIFIIPFMALFWWLWHKARSKEKFGLLWMFVPLFLFWGNMHASYLKGFAFLIIIFIGDILDLFIEEEHPGWRWIGHFFLIIVVVFLTITFVKPFPDYQAAQLISRPFRSAGGLITIEDPPQKTIDVSEIAVEKSNATESDEKKNEISRSKDLTLYEKVKRFHQNLFISNAYERPLPGEFSYPADSPRFIYVTPAFFIIFITFISFTVNIRTINFRDLFVWFAAAILGSAYMRTLPMIYMVMIPLLFTKYERGDFKSFKVGNTIQYIALSACLIAAVNIHYLAWNDKVYKAVGTQFHRAGFGRHPRFSDSLLEYAKEKYRGVNGYNHYNSGTYLIWKWWPEKKVFIDSKSSAYTYDFMQEFRTAYPIDLVDRYELKHAVIEIVDRIAYFYFIPHPEWEIEAMDESYFLFVKTKNAQSLRPDQYLLRSPSELNQLHEKDKNRLNRVIDFIKANQNDIDKLEEYLGPRQWELELFLDQREKGIKVEN